MLILSAVQFWTFRNHTQPHSPNHTASRSDLVASQERRHS